MEHAVVELVYQFDNKSTVSVWKASKLIAKVPFKGSHTYIYIHIT